MEYFSSDHEIACNLEKLYFLPKIHKRVFNVPGRPAISNSGTPRGKASEFLDGHLKIIMQGSWSYIKDSGDFIKKMSQFRNIPENVMLVTANVVVLYPSIPYKAGLKALKNPLGKKEQKHIPTEKLINMEEFVLRNNFFELNVSVKQQVSATAIGT